MYTVYLVLDRTFGEKVLEIARNNHVWLPRTGVNSLASFNFKIETTDKEWNEYGFTLFDINEDDSLEDNFLEIIDTLDLHHNEYSHDPAWQCLIVIGIRLSQNVLSALEKISKGKVIEFQNGFKYIKEGVMA